MAEQLLLEQFYNDRKNALINWRGRYSKKEYPYKVGINFVYEYLSIKNMWQEIISCFNNTSSPKSANFDDEFLKLTIKKRQIMTQILPTVENKYNNISNNSSFNFPAFRDSVNKACAGSNPSVNEIEFTFLYKVVGFYCLIPWAALGKTGESKERAMFSVVGGVSPIIYSSTFDETSSLFGQFINMFHKNLPSLW